MCIRDRVHAARELLCRCLGSRAELRELVNDSLRPADRSGDHVREKRDKGGVIEQHTGCDGPFKAIHQVHDLRDREEADSEGEFKVRQQPSVLKEPGHPAGEEVGVLENSEKADVQGSVSYTHLEPQR